MIKRGQNKGFTIVELIIVIIVVAILASLVALAYGNAQIQARDTQMRDAADKFADAIKLMHVRAGMFPKGGYGSTVAVSSTTGCADGAEGWQSASYFAITGNPNYKCTIGDAAVAMGYLPSTFFNGIPYNTRYGAVTDGPIAGFMVYACGGINYLFFALERRTADEETNYNNASASCPGATQTALTTSGMRAVKNLSAF